MLLCAQRIGEALIGRFTGGRAPRIPRVVRIVVMFHLICLGWLVFRAQSLEAVGVFLGNLVDFSQPVRGKRCALLILVCVAAHVLPAFKVFPKRFAGLPPVVRGAMAACCLWVTILLTPQAKPFIYFQF